MHQLTATYPNRLATPAKSRLTKANLKRAATLAINLFGTAWDYVPITARRFGTWRARRLIAASSRSDFSIGFVSYHLIEFSREALRGDQNASFYSARVHNAWDTDRARRMSESCERAMNGRRLMRLGPLQQFAAID